MKRALVAIAGAVIGAIVCGALGVAWFTRFGPEGEFLGEVVAAFGGGVIGFLAGCAWGRSWSDWRRSTPATRTLSVLVWLGCGALMITGIVYIGGWTDSDGPNTEAMVGILGIPASLVGVWIVARSLSTRQERSEPTA